VFNIFEFEINPLDGGEDVGLPEMPRKCPEKHTKAHIPVPSNGLSSNLKMLNTSAQVETI
jgi:hypothetical protein